LSPGAFADLAALSIAQHRASPEAQRLNEQLSGALTSRVVIEQAKGVISERADVDLAEAFSRLRACARSRNLRLTDVARAAIDGTLDPLACAKACVSCSRLAVTASVVISPGPVLAARAAPGCWPRVVSRSRAACSFCDKASPATASWR